MASPTPYATNPHGVRVKPLDLEAEGSPTVKTYHGLSIIVDGRIVGRINSWAPKVFNRNGTHVYELNHHTFGRPVDFVPSVSTGYTISVNRTEIWDQEFEIALGYPAQWSDLIDQNRPFSVQEYLYKGASIYRVWSYVGCWFTSRNEDNITNKGEAQYVVNGEIAFVSRRRTV